MFKMQVRTNNKTNANLAETSWQRRCRAACSAGCWHRAPLTAAGTFSLLAQQQQQQQQQQQRVRVPAGALRL